MANQLTAEDLKKLIISVFSPTNYDRALGILIDVPDEYRADHPKWKARRQIAVSWGAKLSRVKDELGLHKVDAIYYRNVRNNNADLPEMAYFFSGNSASLNSKLLEANSEPIKFEQVFRNYDIFLAPTEYSATAPMKLNAPRYHFRAVTMPGFSDEMLPALKLDYTEINRRVHILKTLLDPATALEIQFKVDNLQTYRVTFDLRHRQAHASGGLLPDMGSAGNLPSGECYIVPYEGEQGTESRSNGILPIQFDREIVLYRIEKNKAIEVLSQGLISNQEAEKIKLEPAYSNIAEIGFGVLKDFGIKPINELLLDEKLGLHIAFGRSDHFGGAVGVKDFTTPENVVHIDRIYIPETQNRIHIDWVKLTNPDESVKVIMENGAYTIL